MDLKTGLTVEEVLDEDALFSLKDEWEELYARCSYATPFQSPAWSLNWWRHFGQGQIFTLLLRDSGALVGVAPFYIRRSSGAKVLGFMATGPSDYLDIILDDGIRSKGAALIMDYLMERSDLWDRCDFQEVRSSSPLMHYRFPEGARFTVEDQNICPVVMLPPDVETFERMLARSHKKKHVKPISWLENSNDIEFEPAKKDTLDEMLESLFSMHDLRWEFKGAGDVIKGESVRALFKEAAHSFFDMGILRLFRLKVKGKPAACLYSFVKGGAVYNFLSGFDPGLSNVSPGRVLIDMMIKEAIRAGLKEFDFMRGDENYKYFWEPVERINYRLIVEKA